MQLSRLKVVVVVVEWLLNWERLAVLAAELCKRELEKEEKRRLAPGEDVLAVGGVWRGRVQCSAVQVWWVVFKCCPLELRVFVRRMKCEGFSAGR